MTDFGYNPVQRPVPPWPWELSCGLALPSDPPWNFPRQPKRKQTLQDGSLFTFPFAENHIPYMLTDWQPIVGITLQDR
jgi:hypothetical protein